MKKEFENKQAIVRALKERGFEPYGQSTHAFQKPIRGFWDALPVLRPYYHAVIDWNYPILNLHIDVPVLKGMHKTIQKDGRIESELVKLYHSSFWGQLEGVQYVAVTKLINELKQPK